MNNDRWYDLYLYKFPNIETLYKLSHLSYEDARKYKQYWLDISDLNEYMLVIEGGTPWIDKPTIIEKTPEWISLEYDNFHKDA